MVYDFSKPQRQSAFGIIMMAAHTLQQMLKALAFPIIFAIVKTDKQYVLYIGLGIALLLTIIFIAGYLSYRRFTFYLDKQKQEFVVNQGVFNRTQLTVQLSKIQQVNINQNLLQKIIGVYGLKIDTAGTDGQEVSIKAINEKLANALRDHLLSGKDESIVDESFTTLTTSVEQDTPLLKISSFTLLKVAFTSNYGSSLALLIAFFVPLYQHTRDFLELLHMDSGKVEDALISLLSIFSLLILVGCLLLVLLVINLVRTFVKYFEFHISKHSRSLLISAGLFAKRNTLLSPNKVQITTYSQNYFQKKLRLMNLNLKQAISGHTHKAKDLESSNLEIPGCNPAEKNQLLEMILGKVPPKSHIFLPNWRFLNLPIIFKIVIPIIIFIILSVNIQAIQPFYPLAICYAVIGLLMIYISYQRHHLMVDEEFIVKRNGIWDIKHSILLPHKIQAITVFQYPWHKSVDVGHVNIHTAAGIIHFKYGNYTEIKQLVDYWLYQVESGSEEWM